MIQLQRIYTREESAVDWLHLESGEWLVAIRGRKATAQRVVYDLLEGHIQKARSLLERPRQVVFRSTMAFDVEAPWTASASSG